MVQSAYVVFQNLKLCSSLALSCHRELLVFFAPFPDGIEDPLL